MANEYMTDEHYTRPPGMNEEKHAATRAWAVRADVQARVAALWAGLSDAQRRRVARAVDQYVRALGTGNAQRVAAAGDNLIIEVATAHRDSRR